MFHAKNMKSYAFGSTQYTADVSCNFTANTSAQSSFKLELVLPFKSILLLNSKFVLNFNFTQSQMYSKYTTYMLFFLFNEILVFVRRKQVT